jgi:molecular chaperone HscA
MEKMLKDSILFADSDIQVRLLHEAQIDAVRTIEAIDTALDKDKNLLDGDMLSEILNARDELKDLKESEDKELIHEGIDRLESASSKFVEMRMNKSIMKAMHGHNVDEF